MELRAKIKRWWNGETIFSDNPYVIGWSQERHWTSRACHAVVHYVRRHHQWLIGLVVASAIGIAGVIVHAMK
jgi:hypothetical protein